MLNLHARAAGPTAAARPGPARTSSSTAGRAAVALLAVVVAYHYSLRTLARSLGLQTPLAYLGLVPVIAIAIASARVTPTAAEPEVADRQLDYIVGVPLILGALLMVSVLPARLSTLFWVWRLDLLSLPLFTAGVVAITFGVRALWRVRVAVAFLLLAWPLPYTWALGHLLDAVTDATIATVRWSLHLVPIATSVPGQPSLFAIRHGTESFQLNVASACAGVNGVLGFLLLGLAFAVVVRGGRARKTIWLAAGMGLLWVLNAGRILLLFVVAHRWGQAVAIDAFHPYVGLVLFNVGALAMVLAMPALGLRFGRPAALPRSEAAASLRRAVPRLRLVVAVLVVTSSALAVANSRFQAYELVAGDLGAPRLQSFLVDPPTPDGWRATEVDRYPWGKQYFGEDSTWVRFLYTKVNASALTARPTAGAKGLAAASTKPKALSARKGLTSSKARPPTTTGRRLGAVPTTQPALPSLKGRAVPPAAGPNLQLVYADVITTSDLGTFSTYGITQCYRFHGYDLHSTDTVDLGGGINATVVRYTNTTIGSDWTSVSWILPVNTPDGTRYERVALMTSVPDGSAGDAAGSGRAGALVDFAREVVAHEAAADGSGPTPTTPKAVKQATHTKQTPAATTTGKLGGASTPTTVAATPVSPILDQRPSTKASK